MKSKFLSLFLSHSAKDLLRDLAVLCLFYFGSVSGFAHQNKASSAFMQEGPRLLQWKCGEQGDRTQISGDVSIHLPFNFILFWLKNKSCFWQAATEILIKALKSACAALGQSGFSLEQMKIPVGPEIWAENCGTLKRVFCQGWVWEIWLLSDAECSGIRCLSCSGVPCASSDMSCPCPLPTWLGLVQNCEIN